MNQITYHTHQKDPSQLITQPSPHFLTTLNHCYRAKGTNWSGIIPSEAKHGITFLNLMLATTVNYDEPYVAYRTFYICISKMELGEFPYDSSKIEVLLTTSHVARVLFKNCSSYYKLEHSIVIPVVNQGLSLRDVNEAHMFNPLFQAEYKEKNLRFIRVTFNHIKTKLMLDLQVMCMSTVSCTNICLRKADKDYSAYLNNYLLNDIRNISKRISIDLPTHLPLTEPRGEKRNAEEKGDIKSTKRLCTRTSVRRPSIDLLANNLDCLNGNIVLPPFASLFNPNMF